jgi:hypothetical protein
VKLPTTQELSHHDSEDDLDLIQPRTMFRQIHNANAVTLVGQKLATRCRTFQFEVAKIDDESQTPNGLWRYAASFNARDIVDRYEFD